MTTVLVTGAGGFVCSSIIDALLDHGCAVVAVDRVFAPALREQWAGRAVDCIETDAEALPATGLQVDFLIHGAAVTAGPEDRGESAVDNLTANLAPLLAALKWAETNVRQRAVFISSGGVFSQVTTPTALTETTHAVPYGLYAVAKKALEDMVTTLNELHGLPFYSVRFSNIYGTLEQARPTRPRVSLVCQMIRDALTEGCLVVPAESPRGDWTYAHDLGHALHALLHAPDLRRSLYHVTSAQTLTALEIARAVQALIPGTRVEVRGEAPRRAGWLESVYWAQDVAFDGWTTFSAGLAQTVLRQQREFAL